MVYSGMGKYWMYWSLINHVTWLVSWIQSVTRIEIFMW